MPPQPTNPAPVPDGPVATPALTLAPALFWAIAGYLLAFGMERGVPGMAANAAVAVSIFVVWIASHPRRSLEPAAWCWLAAAAALVAYWQTRTWMQPFPLFSALGRTAAQLGAIATVYLVAVDTTPRPTVIRHLGAAAALALLSALPLCLLRDSWGHGLGNVNYLVNIATPCLLAWAWAEWRERREPARNARLLRALLVLGFAALLVFTVGSGRRSVVLAVAAVALLLTLCRLWPRRKLLAASLLAGSCAVVGLFLWWLWSQPLGTPRAIRKTMLMAVGDTLNEALPWGFGQYGALHIQYGEGEWARHYTAAGHKMADAHNELADTLFDGGLPGFVVFILLFAFVIHRLFRWARNERTLTPVVFLVALAPPFLLDNSLSMPTGMVVIGVFVGLCLRDDQVSLRRGAPVARLASGLVVAPWILLTVIQLPATGMHRKIEQPHDVIVPMGHCYEFMAAESLTVGNLPPMIRGNRIGDARTFFDLAAPRVGPWSNILTMQLMLRARETNGDPAAVVPLAVRLLAMYPFNHRVYSLIAKMPIPPGHPALEAMPPRLGTRINYLSGRPDLPPPRIDIAPDNVQTAADLFGAIVWHIANREQTGSDWAPIDRALHALVERYGDIPDIANLAIKAHIEAALDASAFAWIDSYRAQLARGIRSHRPYIETLASAYYPPEVAAALDVIRALHPQLLRRWLLGKNVLEPGRRLQSHKGSLALTVAVICGRARRYGLLPQPGTAPARDQAREL